MRRDQWFFLILVFALAARALFFVVVAHPEVRSGALLMPDYADEVQDDTDETDYHLLALHLSEDGQLKLSRNGPPTATRPPGTVLPIALLYLIFGPRPILGVIYVAVCSLLIVPVAGALARETGGSMAVQRLAMLIAASTPALIFAGCGVWSDTPCLLFILLSLLLLLRARDQQLGYDRRLVALAALSLGLAYLNRPSAGFAGVLVAVLLVIEGRPRRDLATAPLLLAVIALPVAGWGLWNQATMGDFFIGNTKSTVAFWQSNNPVTAELRPPAMRHAKGFDLHQEARDGRYRGSWVPLRYVAAFDPWTDRAIPELEAEAWLRRQATQFIREHPGSFLRILGYKALRVLSAEPAAPSILGESPSRRRLKHLVTFGERWFFIILGGLGLHLLWRRSPGQARIYLLYGAAGLAVAFIAYPSARILLPVTAILIVPAAFGLEWLASKVADARH